MQKSNIIIKNSLILVFAVLLAGCSKNNLSKKSEYPQSIVALSPASVEILYAIGAQKQIAAVSDLADYPADAMELPKVGGFDGKTLSLETIMSYKPDLVYLTDGMHNFLIDSLERNKIAYYVSTGTSIADVQKEILEIGNITGHELTAKAVVADMKSKIGGFSSPDNQNPVTVYYEVWNSPYMSIGSTSFINDVISCAGAKNVFSDLQDAYPMVSEETIIARNPQVILIPASTGISVEAVKARSGWADISAVQNNSVFLVDDNLFSRPGPRVADAVLDLENLIK